MTLLHHQGIQVRKSGQEITPKEIQEILESIQGLPNEPMISRMTLRTYEAGQVYHRVQRTFWTGGKILLSFYLPHQKISRYLQTPQDHKG